MRLIGAGTREGFDYTVRRTFWTVPNVVTVLRFLLVPVFIHLVLAEEPAAAFVVLVVLGGTDWIDGWIARRFDQHSTVGRWLDPLADRLSVAIVAVTLVAVDVAPLWFVLSILVPDAVLAINAAVFFAGSPELAVTVLGKVRTAVLMLGAPLVLLARAEVLPGAGWTPIAESVLAAGCLMHIVAAVDYLRRAHRQARRLRAQGIDPRDRSRWVAGEQT